MQIVSAAFTIAVCLCSCRSSSGDTLVRNNTYMNTIRPLHACLLSEASVVRSQTVKASEEAERRPMPTHAESMTFLPAKLQSKIHAGNSDYRIDNSWMLLSTEPKWHMVSSANCIRRSL
jgi:hypothetical protein